MVELTNGIGLEPRYFVTKVSIEHVEAGLRQRPRIADVHLQWKVENRMRTKCCATFSGSVKERKALFALSVMKTAICASLRHDLLIARYRN